MRGTLSFVALLAVASALKDINDDAKYARLEFAHAAQHYHDVLAASGCSAWKCAVALAPAVVGCGAAAAAEGANIAADAACFAAAANDFVNLPDACKGCFSSDKPGSTAHKPGDPTPTAGGYSSFGYSAASYFPYTGSFSYPTGGSGGGSPGSSGVSGGSGGSGGTGGSGGSGS